MFSKKQVNCRRSFKKELCCGINPAIENKIISPRQKIKKKSFEITGSLSASKGFNLYRNEEIELRRLKIDTMALTPDTSRVDKSIRSPKRTQQLNLEQATLEAIKGQNYPVTLSLFKKIIGLFKSCSLQISTNATLEADISKVLMRS